MHYHTINKLLEELNRAKTALESTLDILPSEGPVTLSIKILIDDIEVTKQQVRNARTK